MKKRIAIIAAVSVFVISLVFILLFRTKIFKPDYTDDGVLTVVTTSFPAYDIVRNVVGDKGVVELLPSPGVDIYDYTPTDEDILKIKKADLFIYTGGNAESWMKDLFTKSNTTVKQLKLADIVRTFNIDKQEGLDMIPADVTEMDANVWTSIPRACQITFAIANTVSEIDPSNGAAYIDNMDNYIHKLEALNTEVSTIVSAKVRDRLIFAGQFPFRYFVNDYDLKYNALSSGSVSEAITSPDVITYLTDKIQIENIPVVLYTESDEKTNADSIAQNSGAVAMQLRALNNISKEDFDNGETYISLIEKNIEVLKAALQ